MWRRTSWDAHADVEVEKIPRVSRFGRHGDKTIWKTEGWRNTADVDEDPQMKGEWSCVQDNGVVLLFGTRDAIAEWKSRERKHNAVNNTAAVNVNEVGDIIEAKQKWQKSKELVLHVLIMPSFELQLPCDHGT